MYHFGWVFSRRTSAAHPNHVRRQHCARVTCILHRRHPPPLTCMHPRIPALIIFKVRKLDSVTRTRTTHIFLLSHRTSPLSPSITLYVRCWLNLNINSTLCSGAREEELSHFRSDTRELVGVPELFCIHCRPGDCSQCNVCFS